MILDVFSWWYTRGWTYVLNRMKYRLNSVLAVFSVSALIKTLFAPFRQTDSGQTKGPPSVRLRAAVDNLLSRTIGFVIRVLVLILALFCIVFILILNAVIFLAWAFLPLLPIIGLVLVATNWSFDLNWIFHLHFNLHIWHPDFKPGAYL